jgi:predicted nucleic acid-binding protein
MRLVFVDTAGWMACADESDPARGKAVAVRDSWLEGGGLLVTSDYVADDECSGLKSLAGLFDRHLVRGEFAQFVID